MSRRDENLKDLLKSAEMNTVPNPEHVHDVLQHTLARCRVRRPRSSRVAWSAALVLGLCAVGVAGTGWGRDFIQWLFVPVEEKHVSKWVDSEGVEWSQIRDEGPYSEQEHQTVEADFREIHQLKQAGEGRLAGMIEGPLLFGQSLTTYLIQYALSSGEVRQVGSSALSGAQAENMRLEQITALRDAGEGEVLSEKNSRIGMGRYVIRFTLSDGEIIDLDTVYPPGTRQERQRIFSELWQLKNALEFAVVEPYRVPDDPVRGVWGILRYTLADGRVVRSIEQIPEDLISEDGQYVILADGADPIEIGDGTSDP